MFGADHAVIVGMSAARLHGAVPRALGEAFVAVPRHHRAVVVEGGRTVRFLMRRTELLDAESVPTEIGPLLVATVEQTVLDLGHGPLPAPESSPEREALSALAPRLDWPVVRAVRGVGTTGEAGSPHHHLEEAARLYRRLGPTGRTPGPWVSAVPPAEEQWVAALAGQTRLKITAAQAAAAVGDAWARLGR